MIDSISSVLEVENILRNAGDILLKHYLTEYSVNNKQDDSPVTIADIDSHNYIIEHLSKISNLPIVSEENYEEFLDSNLEEFWILDPLDGTKEFISKNGEFCICLGFIQNQKPILGIIYDPIKKIIYSSYNKKPLFPPNQKYQVALSRRHNNNELEIFDKALGKDNYEIMAMGSALKFCEMYNGNIDIYLRLAPCGEWDIAAGHAIIESAGFNLIDLNTKQEMIYGKENFLNSNFIAYNKNLENLAFNIIDMVK